MSNAHEKTPAPAPSATARPPELAVVQPSPAAQDEFQGLGGIYTVIDGKRQRTVVIEPATIKE